MREFLIFVIFPSLLVGLGSGLVLLVLNYFLSTRHLVAFDPGTRLRPSRPEHSGMEN